MSRRTRWVGSGLFGIWMLVCGAAGARAQALPAEPSARRDPAAADALFKEGRRDMGRGDYASARERLLESERLDPAAGTLLNLAECEERLGRYASAWQHWNEALDRMPGPNDERRPFARRRATAVRGRVPWLTVHLAESWPGLRVDQDGAELLPANVGVATPVDPGAHTIVVSAPGRSDRRFQVTLAEGEKVEISVAPGPDTSPIAQPTQERAGARRTAGFWVGGIGAASLIVGGATALGALSAKSTVDQHCDATTRLCDPQGLDAARSGDTLQTVSLVTTLVGAVSVGVGAYLLFSHPRGPRSDVAVVPIVTADGAGCTLIHTF